MTANGLGWLLDESAPAEWHWGIHGMTAPAMVETFVCLATNFVSVLWVVLQYNGIIVVVESKTDR